MTEGEGGPRRPADGTREGRVGTTKRADLEVTGIDHIYVTVSDLARSETFYDKVMRLLGFKKSSGPLAGGDYHIHYFNRVTQFTIRPAKADPRSHDPLHPGLNHVCFRVGEPAHVEAAAEGLARLGVRTTGPRRYPEYAEDYFAIFFTDPDGIRLEITNHRRERREIENHWSRIPWSTQSDP